MFGVTIKIFKVKESIYKGFKLKKKQKNLSMINFELPNRSLLWIPESQGVSTLSLRGRLVRIISFLLRLPPMVQVC